MEKEGTVITEKKDGTVKSVAEIVSAKCEICDNTDKLIGIEKCTHRYCTACWAKHIEVEFIKKKRSPIMLACMGTKCTEFIIEDIIKSTSAPNVVKYYDEVLKKQYLKVIIIQ